MMSTDTETTFKIIIIGAGLAGCCLANGLLRHNVNVQVYERLSENAKRDGYQIRLGAHALRGLRACLSQEQLQNIIDKFGPANGGKSEAPGVYNKHFDLLLDLSAIPNYEKSAPISRLLLRDLLAAPLTRAGKLKYSSQFDRYEILSPGTPNERVRVWFEDGHRDDCDLLIAADGSHSKVNRQVGLQNIFAIEGLTSMVAKNDLPTMRYLQLSQRLQKRQVLAFADSKSLYFSAYLPKNVDDSDTIDESLSSSFFGFHVPENECPKDMAQLPNKEKWEIVSGILKGSNWASEYHELVDLVKSSDLYVYRGRYSKRPAMNWRSAIHSTDHSELGNPRVWIMGDAMHAMLPNRGMGGNTALCDTATALPLLVRLSGLASSDGRVNNHDVTQACKAYEDEMIPRAFEWVQKSGGGNMVPVDASTWTGTILLRVASVAFSVASVWYALLATFTPRTITDEAPELKEQ